MIDRHHMYEYPYLILTYVLSLRDLLESPPSALPSFSIACNLDILRKNENTYDQAQQWA